MEAPIAPVLDGVTVGNTVATPYGPGEVLEVNPCYGFKVQLKRTTQWFASWEVNLVSK